MTSCATETTKQQMNVLEINASSKHRLIVLQRQANIALLQKQASIGFLLKEANIDELQANTSSTHKQLQL